MRHAGLNMGNTQANIRFILAFILIFLSIQYEIWYLAIIGAILFYTAYTKFCLMFSLLGINKKLSIENYFHALIPKYSPHASSIFNATGEIIYINNATKEAFPDLKDASFFNIIDVTRYIQSDSVSNLLFEHRGQTYQLHIQGIKKEDVLLLQSNNITDVLKLEYINASLLSEVNHALNDNELKNHLLAQQSKLATTGELIENITHQWKQPLNALGLIIQNIQLHSNMQTLDPNELETDMSQALKLVRIMDTTVDDFRNFFKVDKATSLFTIESCFNDVMLILGASLKKENIKTVNNIDKTIIIEGLKNEFTQVLLNIINNAKDAFIETRPSIQCIQLDTSIKGNIVQLCISDTAGGIPRENLDKIFDSHFTTKGDKEGTGIGLHMSKAIIETGMKGKIVADNYQEGARFCIELPIQS